MKVRVTTKISENNFRNMEHQSWNPPRDDPVRGFLLKIITKTVMFMHRTFCALISAPRYVKSFNFHINPLKVEYCYPILQIKALRPRDV